MGNLSKLLSKPFKAFSIYALIILACSIPVYYLVIDFIWLDELDEHNQIIKEQIEYSLNKEDIPDEKLNQLIENWNKLQPGTILRKISSNESVSDSVFTITKLNPNIQHEEADQFRVLISTFKLNNQLYRIQVETNFEEADELHSFPTRRFSDHRKSVV